MSFRKWLFVSVVLIASGCATAYQPPKPVISIAERSCDKAPALQTARPLTLDPQNEAEKKEISFNMGDAACLDFGNGSKSVYALALLPDSTTEYMVSVETYPFGEGVFAPALTILDAQGAASRAIPGDAFVFRGAALSVLIRHHSGERYLLIVADPSRVGKSFDKTVASLQSAGTMVGYYYAQTYWGVDSTSHITYAQNGSVIVRIEPIPESRQR